MASLGPHDVAREHGAAEIAVFGERRLDEGVAEHRVVDPGLHALHLVLRVDPSDVFVLARRERHVGAAVDGLRRGVVGLSRLEEAVRRRPDLHDALFDGRRLRLRRGGRAGCRAGRRRQIPGGRAAHVLVDSRVGRGGPGTCRIDGLFARHLHARRRRLVVDGRREAADVELRPRLRGIRGLSELEPASRSGVLDRFDLGRLERVGRRRQRSRRLAARRRCDGCRQTDTPEPPAPGAGWTLLPIDGV